MSNRETRKNHVRTVLSLTDTGSLKLMLLEKASGMSRSTIVDSFLNQFTQEWLLTRQAQLKKEA